MQNKDLGEQKLKNLRTLSQLKSDGQDKNKTLFQDPDKLALRRYRVLITSVIISLSAANCHICLSVTEMIN